MSIAQMGRRDLAEQTHRPLTVLPEWLRLTVVPCRSCRGPLPTFVLDRPESAVDFRGFDWSMAGAYAKHSNVGAGPERVCRRCAFSAAVARLHGGMQRERIAPLEVTELEKLRAEVAALRSEKPPEPEPIPADALVDLGTVFMTPAVRIHAQPRNASNAQWAAFLDSLVEQHRRGVFGLNGVLPIEVTAADRRLGPVAEVSKQNAIAILDDDGSVRSEFDRRPDLAGHHAHRPGADTIRIWSELGLGTLVYRPGDNVEVDT